MIFRFFRCGAIPSLVSNAPMETTSARVVTIKLFRHLAANPQQSRVQALQDTVNRLSTDRATSTRGANRNVLSDMYPFFWATIDLGGDKGER